MKDISKTYILTVQIRAKCVYDDEEYLFEQLKLAIKNLHYDCTGAGVNKKNVVHGYHIEFTKPSKLISIAGGK